MKFHSTAIMLLASSSTCLAFVSSPPSFLRHVAAPRHFLPPSAEVLGIRHRRHAPSLTSLSMSTASPTADPSKFFTEDAYTEAAFSSILQLTTVAESYGSQSVEPSMLAEVLLNPSKFGGGGEGPSGAARDVTEKILNAAGVDLPRLRRDLDAHMAKIPRASESSNKNMSRTLSRVLGEAQSVQRTLGDSYVSVEALVLALAKEDRDFCVPALKKQEVKYDAVLAAVQKHRSDVGPADSRGSESTYDALMKYGRDLTQAAREGKLDPVIGRDEETRRAIQILSRRSKNNPILLGDPGTGKTAVAEGIAQRMVAGDVPDGLQAPCKLVALDMGALIAGAKMRGEFEERLRAVLEEVTKSDGEIVLFIDEIHTVVGAGAAGGAMDASNLLKPALARGELRCIGATTMNEYRQYVEKDKALERRFQQVIVDQPSPEDTVSILRGLKPRYELHHGVRIRDEALLAAAKLSHRYIPDRFLPDKAIDLVDEACAKLKNELTSKPTALDEVDRKVIQLEMEKLSLESDYGDMEYDDTKSTGRLRTIIDQLADLRKTQSALTARWMAERGGVDQITELKQRIDQVQLDIENAERDYELNKAAELKYSVLPELASQLQALEMDREVAAGEDGAVRDEEATSDRLLRDEVVAEDISEVVASWTGIPAEKMMSSERDRILSMDKKLAERVIGQDEAIQNVVDAILRSRAGLNDPSKPISSQIFLGPTGVGKTELCKALSEFMFDTEEAIIRIDMSEYMEKHTVSRLVGAPPGYVGYDEGGQLTDAIRRNPYSVVLFDEMEKAHPDVFNIMLQILDDGRVTDSKGNVINFRNTIIIFTSNIGSRDIIDLGGSSEEEDRTEMRSKVMAAMKANFKPEFLNRIDEYVIFNSLNKENLRNIVKIEVKRLELRLAERQIRMELTDAAYSHLVDTGFDPIYGARPLKRTIQRELETVVARSILAGEFDDGDSILVDAVDDKIVIM